MLYCLEGVDAKEKSVRSRLCQVIVACVNSIDELSDHVWETFRVKMIERLFDREAIVRVHAVNAMARLQSLPITEEAGGLSILDVFMDLLQHDPSSEVRRAVLNQIDVCEKSLNTILARKRDQDPKIRKAFYASKLSEIDIRTLSVQQRDEVLRTGLTDRDQSVKQACIDMIFTNWIHDTNSNLIDFLACLDVQSNTKMSESALECFFGMNPSMFESFSAQYLENLTVETAFILRVFCGWKKAQAGDAAVVQEMLPELVQMSNYIRRAYESLLASDPDDTVMRAEIEFILHELLLTASHLDFSDEVGRRVLADVLLDLITNLELGEVCFSESLKLLRLQCPEPAEFIQTGASLIGDFRDVYTCDGSQPTPAHSSDELLQKSLEALTIGEVLPEDVRILAYLRALEIVKELYDLPCTGAGGFDEDPILPELLTEIVIPAVNSQFAVVQASGLHCLGMACTLSKDLASEYLPLLFEFVRLGQDDTALIALRIAFDLVFLFGPALSTSSSPIDKLAGSLYDPRIEFQTVASEGFAKLLLHGTIHESAILEGLLHLYYHPVTEAEPKLRQCLAYFFPAFAFSRPANQSMLAAVAIPYLKAYLKPDDAAGSRLGFAEVAGQLAHLTDASNLVASELTNDDQHLSPHDLMAMDCLWAMLEDPTGRTKPFLSLLTKIRLDSLAKTTIKKLLYLLSQLSKLVATDKAIQTGLKKFMSALLELDDPEVGIPSGELAEMKARLAPNLPAEPATTTMTIQKPPAARFKRMAVEDASESFSHNVLEELDDILQ